MGDIFPPYYSMNNIPLDVFYQAETPCEVIVININDLYDILKVKQTKNRMSIPAFKTIQNHILPMTSCVAYTTTIQPGMTIRILSNIIY
jgi:hypothetical protein